MMSDIPDGYLQLGDLDQVMAAIAPVYVRRTDEGGTMLGFRIGPQHCNPRGRCHGGVWATMADVLMGVNVGLLSGLGGPTISMSLDFLAAATVGQWAEGSARLLRHTERIAFVECLFTVDGEPALRASATFRRRFPAFRDFDEMAAGG